MQHFAGYRNATFRLTALPPFLSPALQARNRSITSTQMISSISKWKRLFLRSRSCEVWLSLSLLIQSIATPLKQSAKDIAWCQQHHEDECDKTLRVYSLKDITAAISRIASSWRIVLWFAPGYQRSCVGQLSAKLLAPPGWIGQNRLPLSSKGSHYNATLLPRGTVSMCLHYLAKPAAGRSPLLRLNKTHVPRAW